MNRPSYKSIASEQVTEIARLTAENTRLLQNGGNPNPSGIPSVDHGRRFGPFEVRAYQTKNTNGQPNGSYLSVSVVGRQLRKISEGWAKVISETPESTQSFWDAVEYMAPRPQES